MYVPRQRLLGLLAFPEVPVCGQMVHSLLHLAERKKVRDLGLGIMENKMETTIMGFYRV